MATKAAIVAQLQNLIRVGNTTTGKEDQNLTTVVDSLVEGYGKGGDGPVVTPTTEEKTVTPTKSTQVVEPTGADYLSKVTVNAIPDEYIIPSGTLIVTSNNTYDVTDKVSVVVSLSEFDGAITIEGV